MYTSSDFISLSLTTPLGKDVLILDRVRIIEQASVPFIMTLEMHSLKHNIDFEALVGKPITVTFTFPGGKRYFNGIIGEIEQGETIEKDLVDQTLYFAKVYPPLWLLKFSQDHQIFQNMKSLDIIKQVLQAGGVTEIEDKTGGAYQPREYCVQYRESYFNYVSRLMEEEGIYYCFNHKPTTTSLVLGDATRVAPMVYSDLKVTLAESEQFYFDQIQYVTYSQQVVSKAYSGADYNFKTASTKLYSKVQGVGAGLSVYRYPGLFENMGRGDKVSDLRIQELEWFKKTIKGVSTAPLLTPMSAFQISQHPRKDLNRKYVVYKVIHEINMLESPGQDLYRNEFVAFPAEIPFHSPLVSPKPIIASTQTAVVTGKPGEEIWCDEYGRIKVQFHWDQKGKKDDKSSCWIRVAQLWAGSQWGSLWTPRVGMEVVVTFLEGDPDRPLITGCVYNSDHMPMYAQKEPTKSTIKSNTTKGGGGFNEFRFEDKKAAEEIYIHAQKDMNTVVEENRTLKINDIDDKTDIFCGDRTVTLHANNGKKKKNGGHDTLILKKGNRKVLLNGLGPAKGSHTLEIDKGDNIIHIKKGDMIVKLDLGNQKIDIKGTFDMNVTGPVKINGSSVVSIQAGGNLNLSAGGVVSIKGSLVKLN